ncbi:Nucleolar protein 8 [Armadillidium nasatum]|uniref:Nucleolar protein 8 n=1 Tax=Armadillidium nasatum TaxID=96803 RepID=A0A5N5SX25_9CRUS|nr:Nucleolar protein 8 [Armadillidium nasatum]
MPSTRIFIGNLTADIQESDIKEKFSSYGIINKIDIKNKLDIEGNPVSRFAYLNLEAEQRNLNECSVLKVEVAKESFLDRLRREREQANQPKDISLSRAKNNEISFNYNFENTNQNRFNRKEYNFNNSSHTSGNFDNYNDNFNNFDNFKSSNDNYEDFRNNSSHRDNNNKRKYGLQEEENDLQTFSSFKRYYPPTSETLKDDVKIQSTESSNIEEPKKGFVSVYSKLNFKEEGSGFIEDHRKEINEDVYAKEKVSKFKESHFFDNGTVDKKVIPLKPKSRNFFVSADDPMLEDAVSWILTPLTEENQEEFDSIKSKLLEVNKLRQSRAKRDNHLRGKKRKYLTPRSTLKRKRGKSIRTLSSWLLSFINHDLDTNVILDSVPVDIVK